MTPSSIPAIKSILRKVSTGEAKSLAQRALSLATVEEVEALVQAEMKGRYSE